MTNHPVSSSSRILTKNHTVCHPEVMTPAPSGDFLSRLADALVSEIKSEMGRRDLSARGLASLIGENPQYVTSRIGSGNPRTGKRVPITVSDLAVIAGAMDLDALELLASARSAAQDADRSNVVDIRDRKASDASLTVDLAEEPSAAEPTRRDDGTEDDDS